MELYRIGGWRGSDRSYWVEAPDGREIYSNPSREDCIVLAERLNTSAGVSLLELKPGDIVVLRHPKRLSQEAAERISAGWDRVLDRRGLRGKVSVVVHEEDLQAAVLRANTQMGESC